MSKSLATVLLAAIAASLAGPAMADLIVPPMGLAPGSEYQLIFTSYDTINGTSSDISTYNNFVTAEAALSPMLPSATWAAVVSTATVAANVNAPSGSYPVYDTAGYLVSIGDSIYSGSLASPLVYTQFGQGPGTPGAALTGSNSDGSPATGLTAGDGGVTIGFPTSTNSTWIDAVGYPQLASADFGIYALSSPITLPTPEPATITLLGAALSLLVGHRLLKRRSVG